MVLSGYGDISVVGIAGFTALVQLDGLTRVLESLLLDTVLRQFQQPAILGI